jgi:hypothetical protein
MLCCFYYFYFYSISYPDEYLRDGQVAQRGGKVEGGARVPFSEACMYSICPSYPDEYLCDG